MRSPRFEVVFILMSLLIAGCDDLMKADIDNVELELEIADNNIERARGLMFRKSLCMNCGMIFIFEDSEIRSFWMKNTLIPLDMIFMDENMSIINIHEAEPCKNGVCERYNSERPAKYVIETNRGFCRKYNISTGDKISII